MNHRLLGLSTLFKGRGRRVLGAAVVTVILGGGSVDARADAPTDSPERLAAQAAGVVGSGDQLALRLTEDKQERTIRPGDLYAEGWKLEFLTATSATLTKDGQRREVGLNPTGALASKTPAVPSSQVRVQQSDEQLLTQVLTDRLWDGGTLRMGLTLEETRRYWTLMLKWMIAYGDYQKDITARAQRAGLGRVAFRGTVDDADVFYFLGPDAPEFAELVNKGLRAEAAESGDELRLEKVIPAAPNPIRLYYQPLGIADPNDTSRDVEGPEPPP